MFVLKPSILHYSHHSVGLGHLVRSLAIADGLSRRFHVVLCTGGRVPDGLRVPDGVELIALPPIGAGPDGRLASLDPALTIEQAWKRRRARLLALYAALRPRAVLIELFPFGRAKFARELVPLLEAARRDPRSVVTIASVRDILVTAKRDQQAHDDLAAERLRQYFDAVIVHADEGFARLEETFRPSVPVELPVLYSGFVAPSADRGARRPRTPPEVLVSAGGGRDGGPLFSAAVAAHHSVLASRGFHTRLVTGPFLSAGELRELKRTVAGCDTITLERFVPDLVMELARASVSVSRCGYNTTLDLLRSGVPAVVVPYDEGRETEQAERARRLGRLGALTVVPSAELTPVRLAQAVLAAVGTPSPSLDLNIDGAERTAALVAELVDSVQSGRRAA